MIIITAIMIIIKIMIIVTIIISIIEVIVMMVIRCQDLCLEEDAGGGGAFGLLAAEFM